MARAKPGPRAVSANTFYSVKNQGGVTRISHHEFLDSVDSPQAMTAYVLQPSDQTTFTWLPAIASRYEQYRLVSMTFRYVPSCAVTTAGTVYLAIDLDVLDNAPSSPEELSQFIVNGSAAPYDPFTITLSGTLANRIPWHYTAHDGYPLVCDKKTYDLGNLYVYVAGAGGAGVGRVYVDYVFEFTSPTIEIAPITELGVTKKAGNNYGSPYLTSEEVVVNPLQGAALVEDAGQHSLAFERYGGGATTAVNIRLLKMLKDFEGLITWAGDGGPYRSDGSTSYEPIFPNVHTSLTASGVRVPELESSWNASHAFSTNEGPVGSAQGGSILTRLRKGEYLSFPQWTTGNRTNTDGNDGLTVTLARMVLGSLGVAALIRAGKTACLARSQEIASDQPLPLEVSRRALKSTLLTPAEALKAEKALLSLPTIPCQPEVVKKLVTEIVGHERCACVVADLLAR